MDFETAFEILNDECLRAVVEILRDDSPIARRRLTDRLAARGVRAHGTPERGAPDPATRYRIHVALHHDHLPRLADVGLLDYDDETVAATPELEAFVEWLGLLDRDEDPAQSAEPTESSEPTEDSELADDSEKIEDAEPPADDLREQLMAFYA